MTRTRIKICGLTRPDDVAAAAAAGADALGFNRFPGSPRHVSLARLRELALRVGPMVTPVLLFVNATEDEVRAALDVVPLAVLQFHGDESPEFCASFGRPYWRAVAADDRARLVDCFARFRSAQALLLDTPSAGRGGSGRTFDWSVIPPAGERPVPVVLAGGLNAGNVGAAVRQVRPAAVDVSSGVESAPGIKDAGKMAQFVAAVRAADRALTS